MLTISLLLTSQSMRSDFGSFVSLQWVKHQLNSPSLGSEEDGLHSGSQSVN